MARSKTGKSANDRVVEVLDFWDKDVCSRYSKNLIVLEGDVTEKNLGLKEKDLSLLKNEVEEIFHCAASIAFNWPLDKIREVNVEGTRKVLDLALPLKKLKKFNHISTAYVCGDYKGIFEENDLDVGQSYNNTYDQSKFEGERIIEVYRRNSNLWIDIFRPCVVVGESNTGKIPVSRQAFYQIFCVWNSEIFAYFPDDNYFFNLVPVDEVSKSILKISDNTSIRSKNYHVFKFQSLSLKEIINVSSDFLGFKKPVIVPVDEFLKKHSTPVLKSILRNNFFAFNGNVKLDSKITEGILKDYNFEYSGVNKDLLLRLLSFLVKSKFINTHTKEKVRERR